MNSRPTPINSFLCFVCTSLLLILSCNKDTDSLYDAVFEKEVVPVEETDGTTDGQDGDETESEGEETGEDGEETPEDEADSDEADTDGVPEDVESRTTIFPLVHDAYLENGQGFDLPLVRLEKNRQASYLMFDLGQIDSIGGTIISAKLQFYVDTNDGSGILDIFRGASNEWSETNLSATTAPQPDTLLASVQRDFVIGTEVSIALDSVALFPEMATFILRQRNGDDFAFASKENTEIPGAKLEVTYDAPKTSEAIVTEDSQVIIDLGVKSENQQESTGEEETANEDEEEEEEEQANEKESTEEESEETKEDESTGEETSEEEADEEETTEEEETEEPSNEEESTEEESTEEDTSEEETEEPSNEKESTEEESTEEESNEADTTEEETADEEAKESSDEGEYTGEETTEEETSDEEAEESSNEEESTEEESTEEDTTEEETADEEAEESSDEEEYTGEESTEEETSDEEAEESSNEEESTEEESAEEDTTEEDTTEEETAEDEPEDQTPPPPASPSNIEPIAVAEASSSTGTAPLAASFRGADSSDDKAVTRYEWNFGDGTTASTANADHTFTEAGSYEVVLTVTDEEGLNATDALTITVNDPPNEAPNAVASANKLSGEAPLQVDFKGSDSSDDRGITGFGWSFPNGTSSEPNTTYTFDQPGSYDITLTVTDEEGLQDTADLTINVSQAIAGAIPCSEGGKLANETGQKIWCWQNTNLPEYSGSSGALFSNRQMAIDSECYENQVSQEGDRLKFRLDATGPEVRDWCSNSDFNFRAEIRTGPWDVRHPKGTEEWFGWSYTFGNDYEIDLNNQWKFFQVHNGINGEAPQIGLEITHENQFRGHGPGELFVVNECHGTEGRSADFSPIGIVPRAGQTLDIVVHAIWDTGTSGLLQIWVDGKKVYDKRVSTIFASHPFGGNAKWGIYKWPWKKEEGVRKSQEQGISHVETYMGALRMITRKPGDPDYGKDSYSEVAP